MFTHRLQSCVISTVIGFKRFNPIVRGFEESANIGFAVSSPTSMGFVRSGSSVCGEEAECGVRLPGSAIIANCQNKGGVWNVLKLWSTRSYLAVSP